MLRRRGLLAGIAAALAAPAIIRTPGLLMPVKVAPAGMAGPIGPTGTYTVGARRPWGTTGPVGPLGVPGTYVINDFTFVKDNTGAVMSFLNPGWEARKCLSST